jgi:hypothetical protein
MTEYSKLIATLLTEYTQEQLKAAAWRNSLPVGVGDIFREDCDGRLIHTDHYGKHTQYGWEIDHIMPKALGGLDIPSNVRARHHYGNALAGGFLGSLFR